MKFFHDDPHTWVKVDCLVADAILASGELKVYAGFTDMSGRFGEGRQMYTQWGRKDIDRLILRDYNFFGEKPCEHYVVAEYGEADES